MTAIQALLLGFFQGVSEFLPISSSGHLLVFKDLLGLSEVPVLFDVVLHMATLASILVVFRRRIGGILGALWRWATAPRPGRAAAEDSGPTGGPAATAAHPADAENLALVMPALAATVVTAAVGLAIERYIPVQSPRVVSALFLVTAALLVASSRFRGNRNYRKLGVLRGLFIGLAQGVGVFPGISRSGITISGGLAAGLNRETAGEFAFLLAIPAILGAFLLNLKEAAALSHSVGALPLAVGFLAAFGTGIAALNLLMPIVRRGKLAWFAVYLVPAGLLGLFLFP